MASILVELSLLSSRSRMEEVLAVVAEASWLDGAVRDEADQQEEDEAEEEEAGAGGSFLKLVEAGEEVPAQQQPEVHTHSSKDQPALRRCSSIARALIVLTMATDDPVSSDRDSPKAIPPPAADPTPSPPLLLNPPAQV